MSSTELCVHENEGVRYYRDPESDYEMGLALDTAYLPEERVFFRGPVAKGYWPIPITSRSLKEYAGYFENFSVDPRKQYLEMGPGLGGFVEAVANVSHPPIVVDAANYQSLEYICDQVLSYPQKYKIDKDTEARIRIMLLLQRARVIQNKDRVTLHNMPFSQALHLIPKHCADALVDCCGPCLYPEVEAVEKPLSVLRAQYETLLRPGGQLFVSKKLARESDSSLRTFLLYYGQCRLS